MALNFRIFRCEFDGEVGWLGSRENLDAAKKFVETHQSQPGEYFIWSLKTQERVAITVPEESVLAATHSQGS
jgi:hypothetical protein